MNSNARGSCGKNDNMRRHLGSNRTVAAAVLSPLLMTLVLLFSPAHADFSTAAADWTAVMPAFSTADSARGGRFCKSGRTAPISNIRNNFHERFWTSSTVKSVGPSLAYTRENGRNGIRLTVKMGEDSTSFDSCNYAGGENQPDSISSSVSPPTPENTLLRKRTIKRRAFVTTLASSIALAHPLGQKSNAESEVAPRINLLNKAVTQSDLGVDVRRSVVRGAQVIDELDGKWEKFSDRFGLGAERNRRDSRPAPRPVVERLPLERSLAREVLAAADSAFLSCLPPQKVSKDELVKKVDDMKGLVRKTFFTGSTETEANESSVSSVLSSKEFNFECYAHFRTYNDILVKNEVFFSTFRRDFEKAFGERLVDILAPVGAISTTVGSGKPTPEVLRERLVSAFRSSDAIVTALRDKGLVASWDRAPPSDDSVDDWVEGTADLQFTIALDGDVTQDCQILLQELGYRLYPSFGKLAVTTLLRRCFGGDKGIGVSVEEYYMDTDYNSDPDLFEVKQVLLNVVIQES